MILHSIKEGIPKCERFSGGLFWSSRFAFALAMLLLMVLAVPVVVGGLALAVVLLPVAVAVAGAEVWVRDQRVLERRREHLERELEEERAQILAGIREP